jgi:Skp family chaperone for outer membrane proteins
MKSFLTITASALVGSLISLTAVGQAQQAKTPSGVAFVSPSRILAETVHGRSEAGRVQAVQQQRAADLRSKQQTLDETRRQLAAASDPAARSELQQKEIQQRTEFERATQQAQAELQTLQRDINVELQQRVKTILDDLMKTQGYQLVLNSDVSVMWSDRSLDLTAAVVGRLNGQQ